MAQTAQHTPGPWNTDGQIVDSNFSVYDDCGTNIALVEAWDGDNDEGIMGEAFANARLIAAAPDLVKALEKGMASLKPEFDKYDAEKWHDAEARDAYIAMRAALAKAGIQ